jgi:hypothetical protein
MLIRHLAKVGKTLDDLYAYLGLDKSSVDNTIDDNPRASKKHKPSPFAASATASLAMKDQTLAEKPITSSIQKKAQKERIQKLTKKDIIAELDSIGDSTYSQYWKKSELVEHLVDTLTDQQEIVLTCPSSSVSSTAAATTSPMIDVSVKKQRESNLMECTSNEEDQSCPNECEKHHDLQDCPHDPVIAEDGVAVAEQQTPTDIPLPNQVKNAVAAVEKLTIRDSTDNKDVKPATKASDNRMSVDVLPSPDLQQPTNEPPVTESTKENQKITVAQNGSSATLKEQSQYETAKQYSIESQELAMMQINHRNVVKAFEPTLSTILSSALKAERSPLATVVNPGHVESAKKLFEKNASAQNVTKPVPFMVPSAREFTNMIDMKPMSSNSSSAAKTTGNPKRLGLSAHTGATKHASETVSALKSKQAQERLEKMREKSKKTGNMAAYSSIAPTAVISVTQSSSIHKNKVPHISTADRIKEIRKKALYKEVTTTLTGCPSSSQLFHPQARSQPKSIILSKPEDNYEMSDCGSDSDSSEASEQRAKKRIPDWARRKNLIPALEHQFSNQCLIDPDELFGEVETCDLCEIFPNADSMKRYKRRNSSGNWTEHRLTEEEKARYKQQINLMKM